MAEEYDKNKVIECMFDPITSEILAELEKSEKDSAYLEKKLQLSQVEISNKLSYLVEHEFVKQEFKDNKKFYYADGKKLSKVLENDKNFDKVIDGLTEMDSYLN
jgi:DNA-binding transcriptional regulator GbsR (MarR family)